MFVIPLIGVLEAGAEMVHAWNKFLQKFAGAGCGAMQTTSLTPKCTLLVQEMPSSRVSPRWVWVALESGVNICDGEGLGKLDPTVPHLDTFDSSCDS